VTDADRARIAALLKCVEANFALCRHAIEELRLDVQREHPLRLRDAANEAEDCASVGLAQLREALAIYRRA
jgi:hypothetical protein